MRDLRHFIGQKKDLIYLFSVDYYGLCRLLWPGPAPIYYSNDVLVYSTPILEKGIEVTGMITAIL